MMAKISAVFDWKPYCWDVLLDYGDCGQLCEWPRDQKPEEGDVVEWIPNVGVKWNGVMVAVDVRKIKIDKDRNISFD